LVPQLTLVTTKILTIWFLKKIKHTLIISNLNQSILTKFKLEFYTNLWGAETTFIIHFYKYLENKMNYIFVLNIKKYICLCCCWHQILFVLMQRPRNRGSMTLRNKYPFPVAQKKNYFLNFFADLLSISSTFYSRVFHTKVCSKWVSMQRKAAKETFV